MKAFSQHIPKTFNFVRPLRPTDDVISLALRQKDTEEVLASTGFENTRQVLQKSLSLSDSVFVIESPRDKSIIGVFGVGSGEYGGIPWLLGSDRLESDISKMQFCRASFFFVDKFLAKYGCLYNLVLSDYEKTIKWLKFLGFTFSQKEYVLHDSNKPFYMFWRHSET